jgi:hypothetical protein
MHEQEQLITLTEATKLAAGRPSTNCVWRWCRKGVLSRKGDRIRLQHVRVGGKIFTAAKWLDEFGQRVATADAEYFDNVQPAAVAFRPRRRRRPPSRQEQKRQEHLDHVRRELAAAGI